MRSHHTRTDHPTLLFGSTNTQSLFLESHVMYSHSYTEDPRLTNQHVRNVWDRTERSVLMITDY